MFDRRRWFSAREVTAAWIRQGQRCARPGCHRTERQLMEGDHIRPWALGGRTSIDNCQALCGPCNREKGSAEGFPYDIPETFNLWPGDGDLRRWQQAALQLVLTRDDPLLIEACPGAGKTRFAQECVYELYKRGDINRVLVVVPTARLVSQWVQSCNAIAGGAPRLPVAPAGWTPVRPIYDTELGAVFTYQALIANTINYEALAAEHGFKTLVILDEVHHAGSDARWGQASQAAFFHTAQRILSLSGTPFRSQDRIAFVRYDTDDRAISDYQYTYGQALSDVACRPLRFHFVGGTTTFRTPDLDIETVDFTDDLNERGRSYRLRTALELERTNGGWLRATIVQAIDALEQIRVDDTDAAGLVIAMDCNHAAAVAAVIESLTGTAPRVACSTYDNPDDVSPLETIEQFTTGTDRWIVAVRMISEGVDIRRLRVLVYATNIIAELSFRQMMGRVVRTDPSNPDDFGAVYLPADPTLRALAERIAREAPTTVLRDIVVDDNTPHRVDIRTPDPDRNAFLPIASDTGPTTNVHIQAETTERETDARLRVAIERYRADQRSPLSTNELLALAEADTELTRQLLAQWG